MPYNACKAYEQAQKQFLSIGSGTNSVGFASDADILGAGSSG